MSLTNYSLRLLKHLTWFALAGLVSFAIVFASGGLSRSPHRQTAAEERNRLIESEIVTATPRGFEPALITRPQGKFILMVDNRSGRDLNFRFSRETGESLHEIRTSRQELDWNDVVDLRPGKYVLTEADHPDWTCLIKIMPQ